MSHEAMDEVTNKYWVPEDRRLGSGGLPPLPELPESARRIGVECDRIKAFLLEKNLKYGNSALDPVRMFSQASATEQLLVRIDDKLSRVKRGGEFAGDDTTLDLIGYLVLLRVAGQL